MVKNPTINTEDRDSIPGLKRSLAEVKGNQLQYFCLGNPMDKGNCQATAHGVAKELGMT